MSKRFKIISYIILIAIIIILGYVIFSKATEDVKEKIEDKALTEIKFLESKIIDISNQLNNITVQNYKVTTSEIKSDTSDIGSSSSSEKESNKSSTKESDSGSSSKQSESGSSEGSSKGNSKSKEFNLEKINVLSVKENKKINWDNLRIDFQGIYTAMPTITLDLYQTNINQQDILNFNKDLDEVAINIKSENKQKAADSLCNLYSYIVKFTESISKDEAFTKSIECKESMLKAYSKIDSNNWEDIANNIQDAINKFSSVLTNPNVEKEKQYNSNKVYVILNEIKNVANKQDKEVFFLKYSKLLEEIKSI